MNFRKAESGAALLTVLTVITVLAILISILVNRVRSNINPWVLERDLAQATYAAESGIAFQLYLERYSDSSEPSFGNVKPDTLDDVLLKTFAPTDTFTYRLDPSAATPEVKVDRTRAFLDITSVGHFHNAEAILFTRFGKALDDSIFGAALSLENAVTLELYPKENITGRVRLKTPTAGVLTEPWPSGLSVSDYMRDFTDKKYMSLESALQKKLGEEGGQSGNGSFSDRHLPDFAKKKDIWFPLGQVDIQNEGEETLVIKGPGRIFSQGEMRIRGRVRLENIQLLSGKDITFEDSVTGEENSVFARGSIFFHNRCDIGIEALAGKDIILRDRAQTRVGSVLITVGNKHMTKGADSLNAIRVVNEALARGFLIAAGSNGRVVLGTDKNSVEGVIMANSVWLAGLVKGTVLAKTLLCESTNTHNCLGTGKINRSLLPPGFVQPLQLGPSDRHRHVFKLMEWRRL